MSEELEKRVKLLEEDVANINNNVAILTTRSENFATKIDMVEMREGVKLETIKIREGLRIEMSELRSGLTLEMSELRSGLCIEFQKSIRSQTIWLSSLVVGAMTLLVAVMAFIK
ncbi:hypothetical protein ID987_000788 [Salmonella enterica]|nr:hypothetical protein [Salmonella enterica]